MHICSPTALMDQLYTPHNAVLAWDITLSIETHFKSLHLFLLSLPAAYHPTPPSYKAHWENTFITASRAMNDYLLDLEYATQSLIKTPSSHPLI